MIPAAKSRESVLAASSGDSLTLFGLDLTCTHSLEHALKLVIKLFRTDAQRPRLVTFVNPLGLRIAKNDANYELNLKAMDLVFCDGIALALAARRFVGYPIERISFDSTSIAPGVFEYVRANRLSVAFVGGRPQVADIAAERIRAAYPGISIVGTFDGFGPQELLVEQVQALSPDVVVCGMGAPRQEAFLVALARAGWAGVGFTCGGYFDHLGDRFQFYPALIDRYDLRWLYRLAREPKRIGYRCIVEYGPFWRSVGRELLAAGRSSRNKSEMRPLP